jgi:DinB family protein
VNEPRPTLDDLRRARGEGWEWPRAATDECPQCGMHPGAQPPESLGAMAVELAADWREFLMSADDEYLRTCPEPGVFSPIQYGAHVRDILRVYGDRVLLAIAEDDPEVPTFHPSEDEWDRYNRLDREELADDLEAQAQRLADILDRLDDDAWERTVTRRALVAGTDNVYRFTVAGIASYAVHEAHHHLLDADGTL